MALAPAQTNQLWLVFGVFPLSVWLALLVTSATVILVFVGAIQIYGSTEETQHLIWPNMKASDVVLKTLCTITEPDRFMLFSAWSTGELYKKSCT